MAITKEERLYLLLKAMCKCEIRSLKDLAEEIWISLPTFRDFLNWKYSKKTAKLVETWCNSNVNYLSDCWVSYRRIQDDDE